MDVWNWVITKESADDTDGQTEQQEGGIILGETDQEDRQRANQQQTYGRFPGAKKYHITGL